MGYYSTTKILNNVYSGETLNVYDYGSAADVINTVYDPVNAALKVNLIGGGGGAGTSGTSGVDGASGVAGTSGTSGVAGAAGTDGTTGAAGAAGTSGTDGTTGAAGTSGTTGAAGAAGTSGTDGTTGAAGAAGTSGTDGAAGTSGTDGVDGTLSGITSDAGFTYDTPVLTIPKLLLSTDPGTIDGLQIYNTDGVLYNVYISGSTWTLASA